MPILALLEALWTRPQKQAWYGSCYRKCLQSLLTVAIAITLTILCHEAHAAADRDSHRELFDWRDPATSTGAPPNLSLYRPAPADYGKWSDMSNDDRKVTLAQMLVDIVGYNLNATRLGKGILALREPLQGGGKSNLACSQRFTTSRYFLRCKLKF